MASPSRFAITETTADYYDGQTAGRRTVTVRLGEESLTLSGEDGAPIVAWPLATLRRVPGSPSSDREMRVTPSFESEERLVIRNPDIVYALEQVCGGLNARPPERAGTLRRVAIWVGVAVGSLALLLFVIAPRLADTIAPMIPPESEIALGKKIADQIAESGNFLIGIEGGVCEAHAGRAALDKMVARLEVVADAHVPLKVRVLDDPSVNAFALPGGEMFLLRGLLESAASADEVAGVLAHEIGHVIDRHPTRNVLRSFASGVVVSTVLGDFLGGFLAISLANAAVNASYSREAEAAADASALRLLAEAEIPAAPLGGFFARLRAEYGDSHSYLATHPTFVSREEIFLAADPAPNDAAPVLTEREWSLLRDICKEK